jgi:peroxiredoxin
MALLESIQIPLGGKMPDFELLDPYGKKYASDDLYGSKGLLVVFTCNHCPYAQALWSRVIRLAEFAKPLQINTIAINPNINPDYPDDSPEAMKDFIKKMGIPFPYLVDENQNVARAFEAKCTPDLYLYNARHQLVYHGRVDDNWKDEKAVTREELKEAVQYLAEEKAILTEQKPSMGCSIKWKGK